MFKYMLPFLCARRSFVILQGDSRVPTAMEGLFIVPVEVLSMVSTQGGVEPMKTAIINIGNSRLHESWQLAVTHLNTGSSRDFSQRDVQHVKKFRNLERFTSCSNALSLTGMPGWQLVIEVAPSLLKLRSIKLKGPSSFEVLKVLQGSEQLRKQIKQLRMEDLKYAMNAADMYCLRGLKGLAQLGLSCSKLPADCKEALAVACEGLSKSLTNLELHTRQPVHPGTSAVFPGQVSTLKKLRLWCPEPSEDIEGVRATVAAVSALVDLQDLSLEEDAGWTAEEQQQALAGLTRLTHLELSNLVGPLALIPAADTLVELYSDFLDIVGEVADALFSLPALQRLKAHSVQPSAACRGKVAQDCGIQDLMLQGVESDDELANLPTMPALQCFYLHRLGSCEELAASDGRYVHLARFLQRHAATLEVIDVVTEEQFCEVLPDLHVCTDLALPAGTMGLGTLRVLSGTLLPALQELTLGGRLLVPGDVQPQLAWLAALPALRKVRIDTSHVNEVADGDDLEEVLQQAVISCLAGRPKVRIEFRPW
jgi:hypothetical protein